MRRWMWWMGQRVRGQPTAVWAVAALSGVTTPAVAHAALPGMDGWGDEMWYRAYLAIAQALWFVIQHGLLAARQLEVFGAWLLESVLGPVLTVTIAGLRFPFWLAVGLAWVLYIVTQALRPIVALKVVDLQRSLALVAFALFLFNTGSSLLPQMVHLQRGVGRFLGSTARQGLQQSRMDLPFLAPKQDGSLEPPHTIYGDEPCPGMTLARETPQIFLNDLSANYLWADAKDIHCPDQSADLPRLPRKFAGGAANAGDGTGGGSTWNEEGNYFSLPPSQVAEQPPEERSRLVQKAQDGVLRLTAGIPLMLAADLEQATYLALTVALFAALISTVINLLFALILPTSSLFQAQLSLITRVLSVSWVSSVWMGLISAVLLMAAQAGSGMILLVMTLLFLKLIWGQWKVAWGVFQGTLAGTVAQAGMAAPLAVASVLSGGGAIGWKAAKHVVKERLADRRWAKRLGERERQENERGEGGRSTSSTSSSTSSAAHDDPPSRDRTATVPPPPAVPPPASGWAWYEERIRAGSTPPTSPSSTSSSTQRHGRPMHERTTEPLPVVTKDGTTVDQDARWKRPSSEGNATAAGSAQPETVEGGAHGSSDASPGRARVYAMASPTAPVSETRPSPEGDNQADPRGAEHRAEPAIAPTTDTPHDSEVVQGAATTQPLHPSTTSMTTTEDELHHNDHRIQVQPAQQGMAAVEPSQVQDRGGTERDESSDRTMATERSLTTPLAPPATSAAPTEVVAEGERATTEPSIPEAHAATSSRRPRPRLGQRRSSQEPQEEEGVTP